MGEDLRYADGFPPGYYYIEKAWITLFGSGSIRELALFVGMLGMGVYRRRRRPVVRHPHNACDRLGGGACTDARVAIGRDATALDACHRNSSGPLDSGTTAGDAEPLESGRVRGHARRGRGIHYFFIPLAVVLTLVIFYLLRADGLAMRSIAPFLIVVCAVIPLIVVANADLGYQQDAGGRGQVSEHFLRNVEPRYWSDSRASSE